MATWLSILDDQKPGVNIQTEAHTLTPPSGQNGPEDQKAFGSISLFSPFQSLTRNLTPDQPVMWYCLDIQVTLTEDGRATPPPLHTRQAPVVEYMTWEVKSGLTEAVVTSPGWAILFYRWQSLGKGLTLGEAWDTTFMLSGAIRWVGKQPNLVPIQYAWVRVSSWSLKPSPKDASNWEGWDAFAPFNLCQHHSTFVIKTHLHNQQASQQLWNDGRHPSLGPDQYIMNKAGHHNKAKIKSGGNKSYGQPQPYCLCPCQISDLKVTEAQCQTPQQCLQGPGNWEVPGIHAVDGSPARNLEAIWRSTCQSSRMRTQKMPSHTKAGIGT